MSILDVLQFLVLLLLLVVAVLIWLLPVKWPSTRLKQLVNQLPGPKGYPIIGNALSFLRPSYEFLDVWLSWVKQYGPVVRIWVLGSPNILIADLDVAEALLNDRVITHKGYFNDIAKTWLGDGLFTSEGEIWTNHRRALLPAFSMSILSGFISTFNSNSRILVKRLHEAKPDDMMERIFSWAFASLCMTSMGITVDEESSEGKTYCHILRRLNGLYFNRCRKPWLSNELIYRLSPEGREWYRLIKQVRTLNGKILQRRMVVVNERKSDTVETDQDLGIKKKRPLIDILLEMSKEERFTKEELLWELDTFMFAGQDTTATSLRWILFALGHHPEEQEKVYQEIKNVMGDDLYRDPTMDDLRELKYMDQVICECQRLYPAVSSIIRNLKQDLRVKDYVLPAGSIVQVIIPLCHWDKNYYPDPYKFNPDNFTPEAVRARPRCSFMFYGYGIRKCIGFRYASFKLKVGLIHIMRKLIIKSLDKPEDVKFDLGFLTSPHRTLTIHFTPRSN